jgi:hypothetical protein
MKIAIIVDDLDPDRRRRCFWEEQLSSLPDVQYELVNLLKHMDERKFFNVYMYDIIIFNWCSLDGCVMYASERLQAVVGYYDDHFIQFVRKGGILIIENQPKRWRPVQKAYDVLLPEEVSVISREMHLFGSKVLVNEKLKRHPLIQNLPDVLHSAYNHAPNESWFPPGSTSAKSLQELYPTKIYSGGFLHWKSDWLPLLYTDDKLYPVMLVKNDGLGLWIVTTMYLASSNIKELIESIIIGAKRNLFAIKQFHAHQKTVRKFEALRAFGLIILIAFGIYIILATHIITADVPLGNTLIGNIALSLLLTIVVSILTILRNSIWKSLRTAFNR